MTITILWSMTKETDIRRGRHCVFLMQVHLVFVAKYRRQIFDPDAIEKLRRYFASVCADFDVELVELVEMDDECDHVHLPNNYPPELAISVLVNRLKGVSSRLLRRDRHQRAYGLLCGDAPGGRPDPAKMGKVVRGIAAGRVLRKPALKTLLPAVDSHLVPFYVPGSGGYQVSL